jgi:hypothetical protein
MAKSSFAEREREREREREQNRMDPQGCVSI